MAARRARRRLQPGPALQPWPYAGVIGVRRVLLAILILLGACADSDPGEQVTADRQPDPAEGSWRLIADPPEGTASMPSVWTATQLVVVGGDGAAAYDPSSDTWESLPAPPIEDRVAHSLVWTGEEVLVWGGQTYGPYPDVGFFDDGAAYDPATGAWRRIATAPFRRGGHESVWNGRELIVWGGLDSCCPVDSIVHSTTAAAYDPVTDTWRELPAVPEPWSGDDGQALTVARGEDVYVWRRGALGHLVGDGWQAMAAPPAAPAPTAFSTAGPSVTGFADGEVIRLWTHEWRDAARGFEYDVANGTWERIADLEPTGDQVLAAPADTGAVAVVSAEDLFAVHRYLETEDRWVSLPTFPLARRWRPTIVDTPQGVLVWGGQTLTGEPLVDGAIFSAEHPATSTTTTGVQPSDDEALEVFLDVATRRGDFGPFPLPPYMRDISDLLPDTAWLTEDGEDATRSVLSNSAPRLVVVGRIEAVVPLLGRWWRPDGDSGVPEYVEPDDERAEELFVGLELADLDVLGGDAGGGAVRAGLLIDVGDLDALTDAVDDLAPMLWVLGTAERTLFDPVAAMGALNPIFPQFGVIGSDGSLNFPLLDDDVPFTSRTATVEALRDEAGRPRSIAVRFDIDRDDYIQVDRSGA